jgi:hypothetical protein
VNTLCVYVSACVSVCMHASKYGCIHEHKYDLLHVHNRVRKKREEENSRYMYMQVHDTHNMHVQITDVDWKYNREAVLPNSTSRTSPLVDPLMRTDLSLLATCWCVTLCFQNLEAVKIDRISMCLCPRFR